MANHQLVSPMADVSQQISPFCNQIKLRRFDDHTLQTLQVLLESKDANLFRNSLKEFLRSESVAAIQQSGNRSVHCVLSLLDFFVRTFAIVADVQSCMALRYEALAMRESRAISHPELQVSCNEWMTFAQDAFDNAFYSIVSKACQNALSHFDIESGAKRDNILENRALVNKIQSLEDAAMRLSTVHAVQVQTSEYLKQKNLRQKQSSLRKQIPHPASIYFRNGIKQKNIRNLQHLKNLQQTQEP